MPTPFSAESHFESKIKRGSIRNQSTVIRFTPQPFEPNKHTTVKGLRRICCDRFSFTDFEKINEMHTEYLRRLKGSCTPQAFLDVLYKAELTGTRIKIDKKEGFIVEERRNSIFVIFESNKIKIYPKKVWDFILMFDGVEYMFICESLKKNRLNT